ncbi:MAG: hypothetical protein ABSA70_05020 [Terriglobia bacterium]
MWQERSYPHLLAGLVALIALVANRWSVLNAQQSAKILDSVVQLSAIGLGFWSASATLLLAIEQKSIVRRLKKGPHFRVLVGYIFAAITWLAILLAFTLVAVFFGEPIRTAYAIRRIFPAMWLYFLLAALLVTIRAYYILSKVLRIAASEEEASGEGDSAH